MLDCKEVCSCENQEVHIEVVYQPDSFTSRLGSFRILDKKPFDLRLLNQEGKTLLVSGETDVKIAIPCDRCLEEVPTEIHLEIQKRFPISEEVELDEDEVEDAGYMTGYDLDVDKLVYDEILVNWPMKVLCMDDCKGICRKCGANLNLQECGCGNTELDPRMAVIQDIFKNSKEV